MKYRYLLFSILIFIFTMAGCQKEVTPEDELKQTISQILLLIEQDNYLGLIENHANISIKMKLELFKEISSEPKWLKEKMANLAEILKTIKNQQPIFSENKTIATYKLDNQKPIIFSKINNKWLINN